MPRGDGEDEGEDEGETAASNTSMLVDFTEVMKVGVFVQARSSFYAAVSDSPLPISDTLCFVHALVVIEQQHPLIYPDWCLRN